jgi:large subunit ribosomal protein L6
MSRVGRVPVLVPSNVKIVTDGEYVTVEGPRGRLTRKFVKELTFSMVQDSFVVSTKVSTKFARAMWGTVRSIVASMVKGVTDGFEVELEINGVGYRAAISGEYINLGLGKSHNIKVVIPDGIQVEVQKQSTISLRSSDKEKLGRFVSLLIEQRPPEPYKGKGIKRKNQYIQRKDGKKS